MRTKRHTSFIPDIGNKTSPGSARQSRQRRRKKLYRKRGCNKIPRNPDIQVDLNRQKKYIGQVERKSSEFPGHPSKELSVERNSTQNTHWNHGENVSRQALEEHYLSNNSALCIKNNEDSRNNQDIVANLNFRNSLFSNLNFHEELAQSAQMIQESSCERILVEHDTMLSVETPLRGSEGKLSDNLNIKLGSALELLDDSTTASSSFLLDNYVGQNWTSNHQEQLNNDSVESHSSFMKTESSSSPCTLFGNWSFEDMQSHQAMEEQELVQNTSMDCRLQLPEQSIQSSQRAKPNDEDLFEVIWQSLFPEPHCRLKVKRVVCGEQQQSEATLTDSVTTQSSSPASRDKKLKFCPPFLRRLYSHH
ncbi:hypothetical protein GpartN1_g5168.t1 [Galdieria partita]|uniref:Uncharacterized protein n=1 Tax=Galdieria partita TaxID=83374 RepID=A0A9C7Q1C9_9RHOD|nr:hypothetical protein GpartN1_g5168.t1 [Galdieria partita]